MALLGTGAGIVVLWLALSFPLGVVVGRALRYQQPPPAAPLQRS